MKKVAVGVLFTIMFVPVVAFAQIDREGYLTPLVQSIIKLLQARISELEGELTACRSATVSAVPDNSERIRQIDREIAQIEENLRLKIVELQRVYRHLWPDYIGDYQEAALEKINALKFERQQLGL